MAVNEHSLYPWHQPLWQRLQQIRARLPHALMLTAVTGAGIEDLAALLADSLLCQQTSDDGLPCGTCKACLLNQAGSHPDRLLVQPEEPGKAIRVDSVRELIRFAALTPQIDQRKVIILYPAEAMNRNAANSLLKTLEEPPGDCTLILVAHHSERLPITIRSRCQRIDGNCLQPELASDWLQQHGVATQRIPTLMKLTGNAPLAALELASGTAFELRDQVLNDLQDLSQRKQEPVTVAASWAGADPVGTLRWLRLLTEDLMRLDAGGGSHRLGNPDCESGLRELLKHLQSEQLLQFLDTITETQSLQAGSTNIRADTLLEGITLNWYQFHH